MIPFNADISELWKSLAITDVSRFIAASAAINAAKGRYLSVADLTKVPWQVIGILHQREASGDFSCHLHNGDSLKARTVNEPKGRPIEGVPPFGWAASAVDALSYDNLSGLTMWNDIPTTLYRIERYNGLGYRRHGINSPYLWAGTNHYDTGKYASDGIFDPNLSDKQPGAAGLLKMLNYLA